MCFAVYHFMSGLAALVAGKIRDRMNESRIEWRLRQRGKGRWEMLICGLSWMGI